MKKLACLIALSLTACPAPTTSDAGDVVEAAVVMDSDFDALEGSAMPPEMDAGLGDAPDAE